MRTIFVFIRAELGKTYVLASDLIDHVEETGEVFSVSGRYDLLARFNLPADADIGRFVTETVQTRAHVVETHTLMALRAFTHDAGPRD